MPPIPPPMMAIFLGLVSLPSSLLSIVVDILVDDTCELWISVMVVMSRNTAANAQVIRVSGDWSDIIVLNIPRDSFLCPFESVPICLEVPCAF